MTAILLGGIGPRGPIGPENTAAVTAERTRAEEAETTNATAITTEVSRAKAAEALLIPLAQKGAANGVATLDANSLLPTSQLPPLALTDPHVVASEAAQLALLAHEGTFAIRTDIGKTYVQNGGTSGTMADWTEIIAPGDVTSVNGHTGTVSLTASDVSAIPTSAEGAASGVATLTAGSIGAQPPAHHASTHAEGGSDPLTISDMPSVVTSGSRLVPSGDETGKTDTEAIKKALEAGGANLGYGPESKPFWVDESLIVSDGTSGTKRGGFLLGLGKDATVIRQAPNTNLATPLVSTSNWWNGEGSDATLPVHIADFTIDVNVGEQGYATMPEPNAIVGPDGLVVFNNQCDTSRVKVVNPARHGVVVADQTKTGKNATGTGYDCNFDNLNVDGYYATGGTPPSVAEAVTTEGNPEVTTTDSVSEIKIGMVAAGSNVAPNTTVTAVTAGKITLSQNALASGTVKLWFGWGQRGFWASNLSGKGCNDSFLTKCVVRDMWGDWSIKIDDAGDWFTQDCHTYASAWNGAQFQFANASTTSDNGFDNIGQAQGVEIGATVPAAKTTEAFTGGETIKVKALPVALRQFTVLAFRSGGPEGGPLYLGLKTGAAVGATTLHIFNVTVTSELPTESVLYWPLIGMQAVEGAETSSWRDNRSQVVESATADYIYFCFIGFATAGHATAMGGNRNFNEAAVSGATSTGEVYISNASEYTGVVAPESQRKFVLAGAKSKGFVNGAEVIFFSVGGVTLPKAGTTYYVINAEANEFELSATKGGAAITVTGAALPELAVMSLQNQVWTIYGASTNTTKGRGLIGHTFQANGRNEAPFSATRKITSSIRNLIEFVDGPPGGSSLGAGYHYKFIPEATTETWEWMVPVTGWWKLRSCAGGNQGGGGGSPATNVPVSGGGGGAIGLLGENTVFLQAGEVLKVQAGAGGSAAGEGATAGGGTGKAGASGAKSFFENNAGTLLYCLGDSGGAGGPGGPAASGGGIPGGTNSSSLTIPGGGGIGLNGGNGQSGGAPFGASGTGGAAGGGSAASVTLGGTGGKAGWGYGASEGSSNLGTTPAGGEIAKSLTSAGTEGEAAPNGSGAGGGGGGAGAYNGGTQGAGAKGGAGGSGWCDALLVG
ncbi:MAG: hypothetical protein WAU42_14790 [Solirubrobacteraceae bacterium]